jgi:hypothetical protein
MCPCSPSDVSFPIPPPGPPGFPFSEPAFSLPFPGNFPEDLLSILNLLELLVPSGPLVPQLSLNFGKDIFDAIMKLLDQFMPFLMLYKFFLPILELIICIIEVLCSLMNPFALIGALDRLFTQCIPNFLNLFPIFALIIMIISLLLLLLALIEYIIAQILLFVEALLRNINALAIAFQIGNAVGVLAIANKLGTLLCVFQNLFVLLALFGIIVGVIQDILGMIFAIPPCEGGDNSNCCGPLTCPTIVQNPYTNNTGTLQYLNEVDFNTGIAIGLNFLTSDLRAESWQLYDVNQTLPQQFWNIVDGYDVIADGYNPPPVYFPTTSTFTATTVPAQAAYTVNLRLFYNPAQWGRAGTPEYIRFNNCIVLAAPTQNLVNYDNQNVSVPNGVLYIAGGAGFKDDNKTQLNGYAADGYTPLSPFTQATLNNFLHQPVTLTSSTSLPNDGYTFSDITYTFTPNLPILMQANLVTAGCQPQVMISRAFVNNVMFANISSQTAELKNIVNSSNFPDPTGAEQCLLAAISALRANMTTSGVAEFQSTASICLSTLQNNTQNALASVIGVGFSPCNSNFTLTPETQFTTQPITVTVNLNENNGLPLTKGIPATTAQDLASFIIGYPTFGKLTQFSYDGYQSFTAYLTSTVPGTGSVMVAFQNQILCTNTLPTDGSTPSHTLQSLDYQFVYAPVAGNLPGTGEGDTTGEPRRDAGDLSRDSVGVS